MKKSQLTKLVLCVIIGIMLIFIATEVHAADDNVITDLSNFINGGSTNTNSNNTTTNTNANTNANSSSGTNTNSSNPLGNTNTSSTTGNSSQSNGTNNSSSYNNTNLPKTGIMDSTGGIILLVVVFIISAVYAYRKINAYRGL